MAKRKRNLVSQEDLDQVKMLYSLKATFATGAYVTNIIQEKSTILRVVFTEFSMDLGRSFPVAAITLTVEDFQRIYAMMGQALQNLQGMGRM